MEKKEKQFDSEEWLQNLSLENENPGFDADEMLTCEICARKSPPTKIKCIYCGNDFGLSKIRTDLVKPNLRKLETWESGYNLIYLGKGPHYTKNSIREITNLFKLEKDFVQKLFECGEYLPIARLESKSEAENSKKLLLTKGLETIIISDEQLELKNPIQRLRKIELSEDKLKITLFNNSKTIEILKEDISLIITGSIFEKKIDSVERYIKSKENKTLSIDETAKDEKIIDIYIRNDSTGYRILTNGFDYSCLENEMSLLAFENIEKVAIQLKEFAPNAKSIENYKQIRYLLSQVWNVEETSNALGVTKKGVGNLNLNKSITITNLMQFTRYSRLQWHLL